MGVIERNPCMRASPATVYIKIANASSIAIEVASWPSWSSIGTSIAAIEWQLTQLNNAIEQQLNCWRNLGGTHECERIWRNRRSEPVKHRPSWNRPTWPTSTDRAAQLSTWLGCEESLVGKNETQVNDSSGWDWGWKSLRQSDQSIPIKPTIQLQQLQTNLDQTPSIKFELQLASWQHVQLSNSNFGIELKCVVFWKRL